MPTVGGLWHIALGNHSKSMFHGLGAQKIEHFLKCHERCGELSGWLTELITEMRLHPSFTSRIADVRFSTVAFQQFGSVNSNLSKKMELFNNLTFLFNMLLFQMPEDLSKSFRKKNN